MMNERYQDIRDEPSLSVSYGTQACTTDEPMLTDNKGERSYYRTKDKALEMPSRKGNSIRSQFNYTFRPVSASLPVTPIPMQDIYFYMAGAAIFTDCTTGKQAPVTNNVQLEHDYLVARAENGQSILLTLEIHFVLKLNPDTGEEVKALMADKDAKSIPGKACN